MLDLAESGPTAAELVEKIGGAGVAVFDIAERRIRAVTHLDISRTQIEQAAEAFLQVASARASS
jgi:hypothetical protein